MPDVPTVSLPDRTVLLDGGMGRELRARGVPILDTIWSANALLVAPEVVRETHADFIAAGADVIITNTYGVIPSDLAKEGIEHRFEELNLTACRLAAEARDAADRPVLIAGSLPPQAGSYRHDLVRPFDEIEPIYRRQSEIMAPHVDLLVCETMSSAAEGLAAATGACATGKPVWVAWSLNEDRSGRLRSGETIAEAARAIAHLPVSGFLANCCPPESIAAAMAELSAIPRGPAGGYANTFVPVPGDWKLDGEKDSDGLIPLRDDLDAGAYADHALAWRDAGARLIGGCCGTGPAHIAKLRELVH